MKLGFSEVFGFGIICLSSLICPCLMIDIDYLNQACNTSVVMPTSRALESDTSLFYSALMSCYYTVTAPTGMEVLLIVRRFDLESKVDGACVDFVDIHNGSTLSAATLNPTALCGTTADSNYTSTDNSMTVYFETDGTGQRTGFDFVFVAISTGACSSGQFSCNSSICIDDSLVCNIYSECGDDSDESDCTSIEPPGVQMHSQTALIAGLSISLSLVLLIAIVCGIYIYQQNRWRIFMKRPLTAEEYVNPEETTHTNAYPVTKVYYKDKYQHKYKNPEMPDIFPGETHVEIRQYKTEKHATKKEKAKIKTTQSHEVSSSSSQEPEWKMWGKTGPL